MPSGCACVTSADARAWAAARAVESAKYAPSGPTRIAAPLPQEPCPSNAEAAASGHGVPVRISRRISIAPAP